MKTSINTGGEFYLADFGYFSMSVYTLRQRWTLIYGKTEVKLSPLLGKLKHVDIFLHDSEHSYTNMRFEISMTLRYMKEGSLLLSDNARPNLAFQYGLNESGVIGKICLMTGKGSDLCAIVVYSGVKDLAGGDLT